jgi:DNA polymerase III subunit delta'
MSWSNIFGHENQKRWFANAVQCGRLASTFLLVGPDGCGKRTFALQLAKLLLCLKRPPKAFDSCDECESCVQVDAGTHPDLFLIAKPPDRAALPMELLVGSPENRLRDGVCYQLHIRPFHGIRRIAIIDDADTIHVEAANSILKTLEEPPPGSVIFLISSNEQRQLTTIRSRSQIVRFQGLTLDEIQTLLVRENESLDPALLHDAALMANGSLATAKLLLDDSMVSLRRSLLRELEQRPMPFYSLAKTLTSNLQSLGDETQAKRDRLRMIFGFAANHYRSKLMSQLDARNQVENQVVNRSASTLIAALNHCLAAQTDTDRNATPAGLLEAWAAELAAILGA